jgi:hypothetical protein
VFVLGEFRGGGGFSQAAPARWHPSSGTSQVVTSVVPLTGRRGTRWRDAAEFFSDSISCLLLETSREVVIALPFSLAR